MCRSSCSQTTSASVSCQSQRERSTGSRLNAGSRSRCRGRSSPGSWRTRARSRPWWVYPAARCRTATPAVERILFAPPRPTPNAAPVSPRLVSRVRDTCAVDSLDGRDPSSDGLPVASDSTFQASLRALQSMWRVQQALPIGDHRGRPLGTRLSMPFAEESLANYLTPVIRGVVRREVVHQRSMSSG